LKLKGFDIVPDDNYGFDFAVYRENTLQKNHTHSIALIKRVENELASDIEKWMKIAHSVNK
jgi:hypothetical protein